MCAKVCVEVNASASATAIATAETSLTEVDPSTLVVVAEASQQAGASSLERYFIVVAVQSSKKVEPLRQDLVGRKHYQTPCKYCKSLLFLLSLLLLSIGLHSK